jgi:hypothetical protein
LATGSAATFTNLADEKHNAHIRFHLQGGLAPSQGLALIFAETMV